MELTMPQKELTQKDNLTTVQIFPCEANNLDNSDS